MILLSAIVLSVAAVNANPTINFPLNSQFPPIARVSTPFQFVFSESTFNLDDPDVSTYSLSNSPSWLHLESSNRTLSGTPKLEDVGPATFELIATDGTGSTNMPVTIIVSNHTGTVLMEPVRPLLAEDGVLSGVSSLSVYPSEPFSFSVDPKSFVSPGENTSFYATSADNSPLPSWVHYDAAALNFSGNSPPIVDDSSAPQIFNLNLISSDIEGFRSAAYSFHITVTRHTLSFEKVFLELNFTPGEHFRSPRLRDLLQIDGKPVQEHHLASVDAQFPVWLNLDEDSLSLSGTPPGIAETGTATISVTDIYGDIATISVRLQGRPPFSERIDSRPYPVMAGEDFSYTFDEPPLAEKSIQLDASAKDRFPWIEYDPTNRTLRGRPPDDMKTQLITIPLLANNGHTNESVPFNIRIYSADKTCPSTESNPTSPCPTSTSGPTSYPESKPGATNDIHFILAISVVLPLTFLLSGILLYRKNIKSWVTSCASRKNKKKKDRDVASPEVIEITSIRPGGAFRKAFYPGSYQDASKFNFDSISPMDKLRNSFTRHQDLNSDQENRLSRTVFGQIFSRPISRADGIPVSEERELANMKSKPRYVRSGGLVPSRRRGSFNPHWPREHSSTAEILGLPPAHNAQATCPHGRKISNTGYGSSSSNSPSGTAGRSWQTTRSSLQNKNSLEVSTRFPRPHVLWEPGSSSSDPPARPSRDSTVTALLPSPRRFSESERWRMPRQDTGDNGNAVNPLPTARPIPSAPLSKSKTAHRRSNSWTTTSDSLSTAPGSYSYLRDYPQQPLRAPSFGSVFNVGLGGRTLSGEQSVMQHVRNRSQRSQESGGGNPRGWMIATTSNQSGKHERKMSDAEDGQASSSHRGGHGASPPPPHQLTKTDKYSYPLKVYTGTSHTTREEDVDQKLPILNNARASTPAKIRRTKNASKSSPLGIGPDEEDLQRDGPERRWRSGETQESRYASIRNGSSHQR